MSSRPETEPQVDPLPEPHVHHWILDEESHGRCRGCGEERAFRKYIEEYGVAFNRIWAAERGEQDEAL